MAGKKRKNLPKNAAVSFFSNNFQQYLRETSLHGFRFIGETSITIWERIFFFASVVTAITITMHLISYFIVKWTTTPIIVGISPHQKYIGETPFPAITICNANQLLASKVSHYKRGSPEAAMMEIACKRTHTNFKMYADTNYNTSLDEFYETHAQSCESMMIFCQMNSITQKCTDLFREVLTDNGLCCVFNIVHSAYRHKNSVPMKKGYTASGVIPVDWNPEDGYKGKLPPKFYPQAITGPGTSMGLTLALNAELNDFYCSSSNGPAFKIAIHSPIETPRVRENGLFTPVGYETRFRLAIQEIGASKAFRQLDHNVRKCAFFDEIVEESAVYKYYTRLNCERECEAKYVYRKCNCIDIDMPQIHPNASICPPKDYACVFKVRSAWLGLRRAQQVCRKACKPLCFDIVYSMDSFSSTLVFGNHTFLVQNQDILRNMSKNYIKNNIAIVRFSFHENAYHTFVRNIYIGFTEFLSNIGGILSLFTGFSVISIAEIIYFLLFRPFVVLVMPKIKSTWHPKTDDSSHHIEPFNVGKTSQVAPLKQQQQQKNAIELHSFYGKLENKNQVLITPSYPNQVPDNDFTNYQFNNDLPKYKRNLIQRDANNPHSLIFKWTYNREIMNVSQRKHKLNANYSNQSDVSFRAGVLGVQYGGQTKMAGKKRKNLKKNIIFTFFANNFKQYLRETSLHGFRFIGETSITIWERLFFLASVITAVTLTVQFIFYFFTKWATTPVIIGISPHHKYISETPFPAITICNANQLLASKVSNYKRGTPEALMIDLACNITYTNLKGFEIFKDDDNFNITHFYETNSQGCESMMIFCQMNSVTQKCSDLFREILTTDGLCCVFNILHPSFRYKYNSRIIKDYTANGVIPVDWNPEDGYLGELPYKFYPQVVSGIGTSMGLTLILNAETNDFYCSSSDGPGFKIAVHNPIEAPGVRENGIFIAIGHETRFLLQIEEVEASPALRKLSADRRECIFYDELREESLVYKYYTRANCEFECESRYMYRACKCIEFFMPQIYENASICTAKDYGCVGRFRREWHGRRSSEQVCRKACMQTCFDITYTVNAFSSPLIRDNYTYIIQHEEILRNFSKDYIKDNIAVVQFFFHEYVYYSFVRNIHIGFMEFLSNIGGILSLFTGFSVISIAEMIYFLFFRPFVVLFVPRLRSTFHSKTGDEMRNKTEVLNANNCHRKDAPKQISIKLQTLGKDSKISKISLHSNQFPQNNLSNQFDNDYSKIKRPFIVQESNGWPIPDDSKIYNA